MPRLYPEPIPTNVEHADPNTFGFIDPSRSGVQIWDAIRIRIDLVVGRRVPNLSNKATVVRAILDTGAPLTLFPETVWTRFPQAQIEFGQSARPIRFSVAGIVCAFRLGWIWLGVQDDERPVGRLPPQKVLAQFAEDGGRLRSQALVGLSHSVLTGRRLVRETTLEPDEHEPADAARRRRTFGQIWRLTAI